MHGHRGRSSSSSSSSSGKHGNHKRKHHHGHGPQFGGPQYGGQMGGFGGMGQMGVQYGGMGQMGQMGGYGGMGQMGQMGGYGGMGGQFNNAYNSRDQQLMSMIDNLFDRYDRNRTGQLEQNEFAQCFSELCQKLNYPPPTNYQQFIQVARQTDTNFDGRVSKVELFNLFKRTTGY